MKLKQTYEDYAKTLGRIMEFSETNPGFAIRNPSSHHMHSYYYEAKGEGMSLVWSYAAYEGSVDFKLLTLALDFVIELCLEEGLKEIYFDSVAIHPSDAVSDSYKGFLSGYGFIVNDKGAKLVIDEQYVNRSLLLSELELEAEDKEKYGYLLELEEGNSSSTATGNSSSLVAPDAFFYYQIIWKRYQAKIGICFRNGQFFISETDNNLKLYNMKMKDFPINSNMEESLAAYLNFIEEELRFLTLMSPSTHYLEKFVSTYYEEPDSTNSSFGMDIMGLFNNHNYSCDEVESEASKMIEDDQYFLSKECTKYRPPFFKNTSFNEDGKGQVLRFLNHFLILFIVVNDQGVRVVNDFKVGSTLEEAMELAKRVPVAEQ